MIVEQYCKSKKQNETLIRVRKDTYKRLRNCDLGKVPDSFNTIINRLLDFYQENKNNKNTTSKMNRELLVHS
jgi:hypothetical protein